MKRPVITRIDNKVQCLECGWKGKQSEMLFAPNPFKADHIRGIYGCPECQYPERFTFLCGEEGCDRHFTTFGIRQFFCSEHAPVD